MYNLARAGRRLALISTLAAAVVCVGPAVGSAAASGLIPTATSVVASTDIIGPTSLDTAKLTATVRFGLLITPTGTVTFKTTSLGGATTVLGTATLDSPCLILLKSCTAELTVSGAALFPGENVITASYAGDVLSRPSSGTGFLYTPDDASGEVHCSQFQVCFASDRSPDGTAALAVTAGGSSNPSGETILISFGTNPISCSTPNTGDIGVFSVSDPTVPEQVRMDTYGQAAINAETAHPIDSQGNGGHVCLAVPYEFITAFGTPAPLQPDGFFEGVLAPCVFDSTGTLTNPPCYNGGSFFAGGDGAPADYRTFTLLVSGSQGDPHLGP
jgi:hypothetical protein